MKHLIRVLSLATLTGVMAGCGSDQIPTQPDLTNQSSLLAMIPAGATIDSAFLQLYPNSFATQTIGLHEVTATWDEATVTWSSVAGAFGPATATFTAADTGWVMVNITGAVTNWALGTSPNNGLLLNQAPDTGVTEQCFASRESGALGPMLVVFFTTVDTVAMMETLAAGADATIQQALPDSNFGADATICVGSGGIEGPFTRSLVRFDVQVEEPDTSLGCTRGKGYWKTHAGLGPQEDVVTPLLPQTLGAGGGKSLVVNTADTAFLILQQHTFGDPSNGITKLYAHLLTAKLNIASGAASEDADEALAAADLFLVDHDWTDWESLDKDQRHDVMMWKGKLEAYNEGEIGPGSCDGDDSDDDHDDDGDDDDEDDGDDDDGGDD